MAKEKVKMVKGVPYEIVGDTVVLHKPDGDVTLPLELGKSAYSVAFLHLNKKEGGRVRTSNGTHSVGNFAFTVADEVLTVTRKSDDSVVASITMTEAQAKYPRTAAINLLLTTLE